MKETLEQRFEELEKDYKTLKSTFYHLVQVSLEKDNNLVTVYFVIGVVVGFVALKILTTA